MQSSDLVSSFAEIAREKGIDRDTLQLIVEDVFRAMIRKRYGSDEAFEIILNPDHGDIQVLHIREVIKEWDIEDPVTEISVQDAQKIDEDFEEGDEVAEELSFKDFGRRAVLTARQTFSQRIRDIEKDNIYDWYKDLVGEVVVGEVYQIRRREILVIHNKTELILPRNEQIYRDRYRKGDMVRAVIKDVKRDNAGNPLIIISRADPLFMERLFELEVPEIDEGIVEIKRIVREPGDRAKVAVVSYDDRVDPVGACVGMKGSRIHAVVRELGNENIDVVQWADDKHQLIKRALSPASPLVVQINDDLDPPRAKVVVRADEVSQAIGRGGINIRLASAMSGYEIDVYREISEDEEDIEIKEFADEIPEPLLQKLRDIGCDTARAVMELSPEELMRRTGMEPDHVKYIMAVIEAEFARGEDDIAAEEAAPSPTESEVVEENGEADETVEAATVDSADDEEQPEVAAASEGSVDGEAEDAEADASADADEAADDAEADADAADAADADAADTADADAADTADADAADTADADAADDETEDDKQETAEESAEEKEEEEKV